ncbi:murein hydrolase activator EnvC family protein [Kribbella sp. NPDC048928]|uniref:murein hydrolase activator EnvC family protein n=1 Tax=Kribbella sp. NPDC048928 TaxID=3364111 RepID=UPI0037112E9F
MTTTLLTLTTLTLPPTIPAAAPSRSAAPPAAGWPLQPRPEVVHGFELPAKPWLPGHRGVDLAGRPGQPVLAATPGTITYAGPLAGRGVITITYGARRTTYEPVVPDVKVGAAVQTGTVIGRLSAAGSHCVPSTCLHWGLLQAKQYLNPLSLLPKRPVRLLPLTDLRAKDLRLPAAHPRSAPPTDQHAASPHNAHTAPPGDSAYRNRRAAKLVIAAAAALSLTAGLLLRRP